MIQIPFDDNNNNTAAEFRIMLQMIFRESSYPNANIYITNIYDTNEQRALTRI